MARTEELPNMTGEGVERKAIKALDTAIDEWTVAKQKRMKLAETEAEKKAAVMALMQKHECTVYRYEDTKEVVMLETIKVRPVDVDSAEE